MDLTVIIPCVDEGPNLAVLLPDLRKELESCNLSFEILLIVNEVDPLTSKVSRDYHAQVIVQRERGYGGAVRTGFADARGEYVLTMDGDLSHSPRYVPLLWSQRQHAEVIIASRYVPGGGANMPFSRYVMSRILNTWFSKGLRLPVADASSGFRLLRADIIGSLQLKALDFDLVLELIGRVSQIGWRVLEVPFTYEQRGYGRTHARILAFGYAYARLFISLWTERHRHPVKRRHVNKGAPPK